jgi:hypothetical protein
MKLRAQITVELESEDFVDAARHQQRFEEFFQSLQSEYGNAELQFRERRVTAGAGRGARPQIRRPTGYVNRYEGE